MTQITNIPKTSIVLINYKLLQTFTSHISFRCIMKLITFLSIFAIYFCDILCQPAAIYVPLVFNGTHIISANNSTNYTHNNTNNVPVNAANFNNYGSASNACYGCLYIGVIGPNDRRLFGNVSGYFLNIYNTVLCFPSLFLRFTSRSHVGGRIVKKSLNSPTILDLATDCMPQLPQYELQICITTADRPQQHC